jgi:hypothetical protein
VEGKRFVHSIKTQELSPAPHHDLLLLLSHKYAEGSALRVVEDLRRNHNRAITKAFVQTVSDAPRQ